MSVIRRYTHREAADMTGPFVHASAHDAEVERLRAEWRKADDGWIASRQQLRGAVEEAERLHKWLLAIKFGADINAGNASELACAALDGQTVAEYDNTQH